MSPPRRGVAAAFLLPPVAVPAMPERLPEPLLCDYAATAGDVVDAILDRIAAGPGAQRRRDPVPTLVEAAGVLLDMRAWRAPAGGAVRIVYSDERQIEGLFRGDAWCATPALPRRAAAR